MSWTAPKTWAVGDPGTSPDLNTYVRDNTNFLFGDTAWTPLSYVNSWVNAGSPDEVGHFRKIGNLVIVEGTIQSGTAVTVCTLPAGYRPQAQLGGAALVTGAIGYWLLTAAGVLSVQTVGGGVPTQVFLAFTFYAEQ